MLHLNNEQPLMADLFELPSATDISLRLTNLRMLNGKRPVFADDSASVFVFPYLNIRFVEIAPAAAFQAGVDLPLPVAVAAIPTGPGTPDPSLDEADLDIDEDFLRRIREV